MPDAGSFILLFVVVTMVALGHLDALESPTPYFEAARAARDELPPSDVDARRVALDSGDDAHDADGPR